MATALEKVRETLNNAKPDDVREATLTELPEGGLRIEVVLNKTAVAEPAALGKWGQFAESMHSKSPLKGYSEILCEESREFRGMV